MAAAKNIIDYYSINAKRFSQEYKKHQFEKINFLWIHLIPQGKVNILDVGAGSGRDASWLAQKGHAVIAVEPADGLRELAEKHHCGQSVHWVKDSLPGLQEINKMGLKFELILMNAVWMHIEPKHREEAFNNLIHMLKKGGHLVMTLRYGPSTDERVMHPVCNKELMFYANVKKLELVLDAKSDDLFERVNVSWETIAFRMP